MNSWRKLVLDVAPLLLFFFVNSRYGIVPATAVFVAATAASLALAYLLERRIALMPLVAGIVVLVFGGLTVALDDALFIKLKPTIVNGLFAAVLLGGLVFKRPLLEPLFNTVFQLDRQGWVKLTRRWAVFFALMATANETAWRHLSTDDWVTFKVFGLIPATFAFAAAQVGLLRRHSRLGVEAGQATEPF